MAGLERRTRPRCINIVMPAPDLDWTFGPAPAADEPPPPPAPHRKLPSPGAARRLSRRTWLLLGAVAVLAVALIVALPLTENARIRQAVEQAVAAQEADRLAGNWADLNATFADDPHGWGVIHAQRLQKGWLPTPISLPGLRSDGRPGHVIRFQMVGAQLARADVARGFVLADGTPVTFAMPQFYQFTPGSGRVGGRPAGWQQVSPPEAASDQLQHIHGPRVDLTYYPEDGDLAAVVIANLSDVLVRACSDWNCPPELHVAVSFDAGDPTSAASPGPYQPLLGSLALQVMLNRPTSHTYLMIALRSRFTGGYPSDAAASEAVRRVVGVQALIAVAQQMALKAVQGGENAYLDAMIAREASRLGLDAPGLRQLQIANPLIVPADLWSLPQLSYASRAALPEALVALNHVLAGRSLTDEARLMDGFNSATDVETWLAWIGMGPAEVQERLGRVFGVPFPAVTSPSFTPDVVFSCPSGPLLATLAGQSAPLLAGPLPDSLVEAFSPDGQKLALRVSGRLSWLSLAHSDGQFLPSPSWQEGVPPVWASSDVLVYPYVRAGPDGVTPLGNTDLLFFKTSTSGYQKTLVNTFTYVPSPDGIWAAFVGPWSGPEVALNVVPADGGQPIFTATDGYTPAWSPDSRRLAFVLRDGADINLLILNLATRDKLCAVGRWAGPSRAAADRQHRLDEPGRDLVADRRPTGGCRRHE